MSLKKVAARMHVEAKKRGVSRRVLTGGFVTADNHSRGLVLNLWYRDDDIVLGLRRRGVKPSEKEVAICASNFFFSKKIEKRAEASDTVWIGISKKAIYSAGSVRCVDTTPSPAVSNFPGK